MTCLFRAKFFLLYTSDLCWVSRLHVGGVSDQNTFRCCAGRHNNAWYIATIKDRSTWFDQLSVLSRNWITVTHHWSRDYTLFMLGEVTCKRPQITCKKWTQIGISFFFISIFWKKLGKFPGVGTHKLSKSPGVGTKKEGKCPVPGIVAFQHFLTNQWINWFFVGRQKIFTRRLVCGEFRQVCDKIGACRAISDSARSQNVLSGLVG